MIGRVHRRKNESASNFPITRGGLGVWQHRHDDEVPPARREDQRSRMTEATSDWFQILAVRPRTLLRSMLSARAVS